MLSDLRDSGSIEQDADIVMMMYREGYYDEDAENKNLSEIIVAKNRNGPTGHVELYFHPSLLKFQSYSNKKQN